MTTVVTILEINNYSTAQYSWLMTTVVTILVINNYSTVLIFVINDYSSHDIRD